MFEQLDRAIAQLEASFAALDPQLLDGAGALRLVERYVHIERVAAAGRLGAARRVEQTRAYGAAGYRSGAAWLADVAGISTVAAASALTTASQLEGLSVTADALASGLISEAEARAVASAASVDAKAEADLLAAAQIESLQRLQEQARRRRAAAQGQEDRDERIRANRRLSDFTDEDGATCVSLRMAADDGARLLAAVDARAEQIFQDAYRAGRREPLKAYRLDALLALVDEAVAGRGTTAGRGVDTCINVLVDYSALVRGRTEAGEQCHIPGVGPVSVATARRLLADSILKLIVTDGVDVYNVTHVGRTIPAHLRSALVVRDQQCCRPGCGETRRFEIHHYQTDYAELPVARLDGLARLCHWHHRQATLGRPPQRRSGPLAMDRPDRVSVRSRPTAHPGRPRPRSSCLRLTGPVTSRSAAVPGAAAPAWPHWHSPPDRGEPRCLTNYIIVWPPLTLTASPVM